ncbi:MAG: hypothetical protein N2202_04460 [Proteobacteria bacterium]|nr:hypothetical protein [Pseudomonadota bacterium]
MSRKAIFFLIICFFLGFHGCGKKGPLRPPIVSLPGVKEASFLPSEDRILINAIMDREIDFFKIERIELDTNKKPLQQKLIYEGIENKVSFIDKNLDREKNYQYKITPYLKNRKQGKIYISNPISIKVIMPPYNLKGEILETKGTVSLYFEGEHCESFNIYRYKSGDKKPFKPFANVDKTFFVDEMPLYGVELIYEVSCVVKGQESINNPTFKVIIK